MNGLIPTEHNKQRILTTKQIADEYGTDARIISNNFSRNKDRYITGKHYYCLEGEAKRKFLNLHQIDDGSKNASAYYLWTEKGALLHAKSLNTDEAWAVYEELVENYFRADAGNTLIPQTLPEALRLAADLAEKNQQLITESEKKDQLIGELLPKADYVDLILSSSGTMTAAQIAADYGITANRLNKILHEDHIHRSVNKQWILYKEYMGMGYTQSETIPITRSDGRPDTKLFTKWTQKGRLLINEILNRRGIYANIDMASPRQSA